MDLRMQQGIKSPLQIKIYTYEYIYILQLYLILMMNCVKNIFSDLTNNVDTEKPNVFILQQLINFE